MSQVEDGGPAFPGTEMIGTGTVDYLGHPIYAGTSWHGMSLRDYFAGQALAGMATPDNETWFMRSESIVARAYQLADAMLAARAQEQPTS